LSQLKRGLFYLLYLLEDRLAFV